MISVKAAYKKWCHVSMALQNATTLCCGADCMAWVVDISMKKDDAGNYTNTQMPDDEWLGHCGLVRQNDD